MEVNGAFFGEFLEERRIEIEKVLGQGCEVAIFTIAPNGNTFYCSHNEVDAMKLIAAIALLAHDGSWKGEDVKLSKDRIAEATGVPAESDRSKVEVGWVEPTRLYVKSEDKNGEL